jgi:hypothetical protein
MDLFPVDIIITIFGHISLLDVRSLYLAYRKEPTETILRKLSYLHDLSYEDSLDNLIINSLKDPLERYNQALKIGNYNLAVRYLPDPSYFKSQWTMMYNSNILDIFKSNLTTEEKDSLILHLLSHNSATSHFRKYCLDITIDAKHYKLIYKLLVKYSTLSIPSYNVGKILKKAPLEDLEPLLPYLTINCLNSYDVNPTKDVRRILMVKPYFGDSHQSINLNDILDPYKQQAFEDLKLIVTSIGWKYCYYLNEFALKAIMARNIPIIDLLATQKVPYLLNPSDSIFKDLDTLEFVISHPYLKTRLSSDFLFKAIQDNAHDIIKILHKYNIPFDDQTIIWSLNTGFNEGAKYAEKIYGNSDTVEYYRRVILDNPEHIIKNSYVFYNVVISYIYTITQ